MTHDPQSRQPAEAGLQSSISAADDTLTPEQLAILKADRDRARAQIAAQEDASRLARPMAPTAQVLTFQGRCRYCQVTFDYQAPGVLFPDGHQAAATGPRTVCDGADCMDQHAAQQQLVRAEEERQATEAADARARIEYERWVPALYHREAQPGHEARAEHVVEELTYWHPTRSLYVWGPSGSGKSHQVASLMHHVAGRYTMEWYSTRRLIADAQAAIGSKKLERPEIFGQPCRPQVLVLNDLGAERATEYAVAEVGNLIDARYDAGLPVVVTSNLSLAELAAKVDAPLVRLELDRIAGRLLQMTTPPKGIRHRLADRNWRAAIAQGGQR